MKLPLADSFTSKLTLSELLFYKLRNLFRDIIFETAAPAFNRALLATQKKVRYLRHVCKHV